MTYDETTKTLTADEGKILRRTEDGMEYGSSMKLGYSYYIGGKKLSEPHADVPSDFEEADAPRQEQESPAVSLEDAKAQMIENIKAYDASDSVNSFLVNGNKAWMTNTERTSYTASVSNAELLGETSVDLLLNGTVITLPTANAKVMLAQISRYADKCWMVTQQHLLDVEKLTEAAEVLAYDYKAGYPDKLEFTL